MLAPLGNSTSTSTSGGGSGFGNISDPLQALTDVLWGICNTSVDAPTCAGRMSGYESQLHTACKDELAQQVALVVTALNGVYRF